MSDPTKQGEIETVELRMEAYGLVTYPDGTVPMSPDYQPPKEH